MANRVIRDWTTSETMDVLSPQAEVFFTRLIMKADDYGSFHAHPKLLNSALFPLKEYDSKSILGWVDECLKAKLLIRYSINGKDYVRIENFGQRLRNMRNTFPQPDGNSNKVAANGSECRPETKRNEVEIETEYEHVQQVFDSKNLEQKLEIALDEIYLEGQRPKWGHIEFDFELNSFKEKVRGSPEDYVNHDTSGIRKAFQYQLRFAKHKQHNGNGGIKNSKQQHTDSLIQGIAERYGAKANGQGFQGDNDPSNH